MLTDKCRNQEATINDLEEKYEESRQTISSNSDKISELEQKIASLLGTSSIEENLNEKIADLEVLLENSNKQRNKMKNILKQATDSLMHTLSVKNKLKN
jgi:chromosome segregation ATPase